jgi:hypothetical protein
MNKLILAATVLTLITVGARIALGASPNTGVVHACDSQYKSMTTTEFNTVISRALDVAGIEHTQADDAEIAARAQVQMTIRRVGAFTTTVCASRGTPCVALVCEE